MEKKSVSLFCRSHPCVQISPPGFSFFKVPLLVFLIGSCGFLPAVHIGGRFSSSNHSTNLGRGCCALCFSWCLHGCVFPGIVLWLCNSCYSVLQHISFLFVCCPIFVFQGNLSTTMVICGYVWSHFDSCFCCICPIL